MSRERRRAELALEEQESPASPTAVEAYVDLGWRAALTGGWLRIAALISLGVLALELRHAAVVGDASVSFADKVASEDLLNLGYVVTIVVFVITPVVFLIWFFQAYCNLSALGARARRVGNVWAIFSWFVPILNLVLPKKIANDLWRAGDPGLPPQGSHRWHDCPVAARLHWWWAVVLVGGPLNRVAGSIYENATTAKALRDATLVAATGSVVTIAGLVMAAVVVGGTTRRLQARAEKMRAAMAASRTATVDDRGALEHGPETGAR